MNKYNIEDIVLLPRRAKSEEQARKSAITNVVANMSLSRPLNLNDIRFAVKCGFDWGREYTLKETTRKKK